MTTVVSLMQIFKHTLQIIEWIEQSIMFSSYMDAMSLCGSATAVHKFSLAS